MGMVCQKVDYMWKAVMFGLDHLVTSCRKQADINISNLENAYKSRLASLESDLYKCKAENEKIEARFEKKIKNQEKEIETILERNNLLEVKFAEMLENQNRAHSVAKSRGLDEFEYKTKQLSRYLDKIERINDYQDKLINEDLETAITVATRKNLYFKDACCGTDLSIGINQYVQSYFGLLNNNTGQNIMLNQMLSHPLESFFVKDMIYKKQITNENFEEIFEKFVFERSTISNHDPCYSLLEYLSLNSSPDQGKSLLPGLNRQLTKMCLHFSKYGHDDKTKELFSTIFGIQRHQRLSGIEWANLCFIQKIMATYFRKVSGRSLASINFRTRVAKAELMDISKLMTKMKRDLDIDSILADLSWLQVKSSIEGGFLDSVEKKEIPKDHLILILVEKMEIPSFSEAIKRIAAEFQARDQKCYGFILKADLDEITTKVLNIPEDKFKRYHDIWFNPYLQHGIFFDYHNFVYEFVKAFLKGVFDPSNRNPEVYVIDILLMKAKYLRKVSWIEKERIKDYLSDQLNAIDLDNISQLIYSQRYTHLDERNKAEVFKTVSAVRGTFEGRVVKDSGYSFKVMSSDELSSLLNSLSDYIITTGVGNLADRVLEKPNQQSHFK